MGFASTAASRSAWHKPGSSQQLFLLSTPPFPWKQFEPLVPATVPSSVSSSNTAASYVRLAPGGEFPGCGIDCQARLIEAYAAAHGLQVVERYADLTMPNQHTRPAFEQVLRDAACGAFRTVLVACPVALHGLPAYQPGIQLVVAWTDEVGDR